MYANNHIVAVLAAGGTVAAVTGWSVAGWLILGAALAACMLMTARRLYRLSRRGRQ
jgi:hypothetical protein